MCIPIDSPAPSAPSFTPKASQGGDNAADAPTPVSVSAAGVGALEVVS